MKPLRFLAGMIVGGCLAAALGLLPGAPIGIVGARTPRIEHIAQGPEVAGVRFLPQAQPVKSIAAGSVVARDTAVQTAERISDAWSPDGLIPGITVSEQFGLYSDDDFGPINSSGVVQPRYQSVPVWYVTFDGLSLAPANGPSSDALNNHEEEVVVDATSGKVLDVFTYK